MTAIRALVADRVRIPFRRPFATGTGMWVERDAWILRLVDADGRIGLGEAVVEPADGEVAETILAALVREAVEGASEGRLPSFAELEAHGAPGRALNAALEAAVFDLDGLSGADGDPDDEGVGVNATIPSLGTAAAAEAALQSVESGFQTLKAKAGAERETEVLVDRVRAIRAAVGPEIRLRLDVNGAWDLAAAVDRLEAIARFDIEFVEQPLPAHDVDGMAELRRRVRVPIAADEAAASVRDVRGLLAADAVDALVIKPVRVGGPSAVAAIAELAAERDVAVVISTLFETGIGIAAGVAAAAALPDVASARWPIPPDHGLATAGLLEHDLLAGSLVIEDGRIRPPRLPGSGGLGVILDGRALERFRVEIDRADAVTAPVTLFPSLADSARLAATAPGGATGPAIVDGSARWTWRDLDARAEAVAQALAGAGVAAGDRVALLAEPSAPAIAALHGIARLGAVAAPLPTGLTRTELAVAAAVLKPRVSVGGPGLEAWAAALGRPVLALMDVVEASTPAPETPARPAVATDPAAPAVIVLTSGTTARPKAVVLSTAALVASAEAWLAALPQATGWLLALGLGHVAGLGVVWRAALTGVPLIVLARPDAAMIAATLGAQPAVSHVSLVPAVLVRLLEATAGTPPPPTLRAVLLGGGEIPAALVIRALEAGWPVIPTYGLSEAGSGVTALPTADAANAPASAGRALPGVELRMANADGSGVGEIQVRSAALFDGYLDDPAATAAARTDDGWLRTGDLGRLDADDRLFVLDRRTDRIVRGGENISPAEVEEALLDHPAVSDAAVVARRDAVFGQAPVAAIVLRDGIADPGDDALATFLAPRLSRFKLPVGYLRLAALPRTPSGKLQRAAIRAMVDPADDPPRKHRLDRPGGVTLAYRTVGSGPVHILLLHGTLSTAGQLTGLARLLASPGDVTVHAVDRRGSGDSRLVDPAPLDVATHLDDLVAVLDAEGLRAAVLVGVSYGGIAALEFAAHRPDRALAVVAYEPPYGPLADELTKAAFATVAAATERAFETGGSAAAAAEAFMRGVAGERSWDRLPDRARAFLASEGASAYVDAGLRGLDPDGLGGIQAPATILTGDASEPFYRPIADALAGRIPGARRVHLPGMAHASPITEPGPIAAAIRSSLAAAGLIQPDSDSSAAEEPLP